MRNQVEISQNVTRNLPYLVTSCDDCNRADYHSRSGDFEEQPEMTVIGLKNLGYKIKDTLLLHITRLQFFTSGSEANRMSIPIALGDLRGVGNADRTPRQLAVKGEACLRSELLRDSG